MRNRSLIVLLFFVIVPIICPSQTIKNKFFAWPSLFIKADINAKLSYEEMATARAEDGYKHIQVWALSNTIYLRLKTAHFTWAKVIRLQYCRSMELQDRFIGCKADLNIVR